MYFSRLILGFKTVSHQIEKSLPRILLSFSYRILFSCKLVFNFRLISSNKLIPISLAQINVANFAPVFTQKTAVKIRSK